MKLLLPFLKPVYTGLDPLAYLLIRITAGLLLVPHGAHKLFGWLGGDPAKEIAAFHAMGFEPAAFFVTLTGCIQLVGGLLLAIGLLTRPVAATCAGLLAVTIYVTSAGGWSAMEYSVLWTAVCLAIAVLGGGRLSLDRVLGREF